MKEQRSEIIKQVQQLEKEMSELRKFMFALKEQDTTHWGKSCYRVFFRKRTRFTLFSVINGKETHAEFQIPELKRVDLYAMCEKWLKDLESKADSLIGR